MNRTSTIRTGGQDYLSVIHKSDIIANSKADQLQDAVLQTDLSFNITGWNMTAETLYGKPGAMGKNLFQIIDLVFLDGSPEELKDDLRKKGSWSGEVIYKRHDGKQIHFRSIATHIINEKDEPVSVMIVNHNINDIKSKEQELAAAEKKYQIVMNTLPEGVVMINADGKIEACNKRGAEILGFSEQELLGKITASPVWKAIKEDGSVFPLTEFPAIVSLQTGFPQRNVIMGIEQPSGLLVWVSVNTEALIKPGEFEPYAVVASYSDITDSMKTEKELKESNERFYYASKVTSDAIWDIDLETNQIYRSETFFDLSGYLRDETDASLDWWFHKIHPEDRDRVKAKVNEHIQKGLERWDDEYRFECADGSYKFLFDSGIILYRHGKPSRILGALRDLTEKRKLKKQLADEQNQRHKAIAQASITAQEQEKTNISRELHDNVNQILMSAKLFMDTAQKTPEQSKELLDKAIEYQLLALQEIRKLSQSLSTSHIKTVGLKNSVNDIVQNMKLLQQLEVHFIFNSMVEERLSNDQKLMVFRIIQEQTNNIAKHAEAKTVQIMINEMNDMLHLVITDDGKGFDPEANGVKGIGFINITSRADAYNGTVNFISSPGNGCTLELCFPINK